jgi:hypothetical protein
MSKERRWAKAGRGLVGLPLGSSRGTLIVAAVLVALFVAVIAVVTTSGPLRHSSFPGHPYPPSGFVQNPFSSKPDDLLNVTDVARMKAEFSRDGNIDVQAIERGDTTTLSQARTGRALDNLRQFIESNNAQGIVERQQVKDDVVVVGRLSDPNDPRITWCVEERGSATVTDVVKSGGRVARTNTVRFGNRIWLVQVDGRYLIADVEVLS